MEHETGTTVSIHAGFPNPAADTTLHSLDLNQLLIAHASSTYLMRISGNEWRRFGIFDGDVAVVDRALDVHRTDLVIWLHDDCFAISYRPAVPTEAICWGVVTAVIHQYRQVMR
jgi:DNA polymerase V